MIFVAAGRSLPYFLLSAVLRDRHPAFLQHVDLVSVTDGAQAVSNYDPGRAAAGDALGDDVLRAGGFVEDQQARIANQGLSNH